MKTRSGEKTDIVDRLSIQQLVDRFYDKVQQDSHLGPIFNDIAKVDWDEHLPKLYDFWETVLFRTGTYKGNPLVAHRQLIGRADLRREMFDRWLEFFHETVDENFEGDNADHIKRIASDMANVIHARIHELPQMAPSRYAR